MSAVEPAESVVADVGGAPRGSLRVTAPLDLGRHVLTQLIPEFSDAFPQINGQLRLPDHPIDPLNASIDAAVRMAVLPDSSMIVRKIMGCDRISCAAPNYLDARGTPKKPDGLLTHECLLLRFPS